MSDESKPRGVRRPSPLADQIAGDIRERIATGELRPGDRIPSETDICRTWGVAKMTAARALGRLKSAGLVETIPGSGTVVRERRAGVSPSAQLTRMQATGRIRLPNEYSRVMETGELDCADIAPEIVTSLGLTVSSGAILYRRRVVFRDEQPMCVVTSWIASTLLAIRPEWGAARQRLLAYDPVPEGTPVVVAGVVDEELLSEEYVASAEVASVMEADLLGIQPGAPVLRVMSTMSGHEWPLEVGVYTYPAGTPVDFPPFRNAI